MCHSFKLIETQRYHIIERSVFIVLYLYQQVNLQLIKHQVSRINQLTEYSQIIHQHVRYRITKLHTECRQ